MLILLQAAQAGRFERCARLRRARDAAGCVLQEYTMSRSTVFSHHLGNSPLRRRIVRNLTYTGWNAGERGEAGKTRRSWSACRAKKPARANPFSTFIPAIKKNSGMWQAWIAWSDPMIGGPAGMMPDESRPLNPWP
jgi:hypothetical protein